MPAKPSVHLLGGGQLGRMYIENALRYDVEVHVLDPDPDAPCAAIATRFTAGRFSDFDTVMRFAADAEVVGIEIEDVNVEALAELQRQGKRVVPTPEVLRTIKDKGLQKRFYQEHGIPTAAFALTDGVAGIRAHAHLLPAFLKARTGGYDGRGVMRIATPGDADRAFDGPCVLEREADIAMELAVLTARFANGTMVTYDAVEMVFDPRYHLVDHLRAPARITAGQAATAKALGRRVAEAFAAPGLYAVEMFLTKDGELLVNETAPRAHNSGHHTIEACPSSQFDQLLRIHLGWPPGDATLQAHAAMVNLVGEAGTGPPELRGIEDILHVPGTFVHLYGKRITRPGRKMGHVTALAADHAGLDQAIAVTRVHGRVVPAAHTETQRT